MRSQSTAKRRRKHSEKPAPPPPVIKKQRQSAVSGSEAAIADRRALFARKTGTKENLEARAFIEGKIEMVRSDTRMSEAEKSRAIAELKRQIEESA